MASDRSGAPTGSRCRYGAALRADELDAEPRLRDSVLRDCTQITPEVHMMWKALEPQPGQRDYAQADRLLAFADTHGLQMHGHSLLWGLGTPDWAIARLAAQPDWSLVGGHVARTLERYGASIPTWSVVNEPINVARGATGLRDTPFLRAFGAGYVERALREARAAAPHAKLMINDFGFDYENPEEQARRRALLELLRTLRRNKAPLDGVGLQAHLDLAKGPIRAEPLRSFFAELSALDLEIAITELDVQEADYAAPLQERDMRVAAEAGAYLDAALNEPAVTSVTTWGLTDRHSWLQGPDKRSVAGEAVALTPARRNRGLPYDADLEPTPMYWALRRRLALRNV